MKRFISLFLLLSIFTFVSCEEAAVEDPADDPNVENPAKPDDPDDPDDPEKPDDPENPQDVTYNIFGAIQKGPFVQGSSITISELDDELNSTGVNYQTVTTDDTGSFEIGSKIKSRYVEISANGYYFNEVSGKISSSELTLRTISDLEAGGEVNVNLLTSLANAKLKSLIKAGGEDYTFDKALKEAETCVLDAFGLERSDEHFDKMDITEAGDANAMLLAVSVTVQGDRSVGEMSELIAKIGAEIESAGEIKTPAIQEAIQQGAVGVDLEQVRENLNNRYSDLGADCTVPDFENFIDSDGDGKVDSDEAWLLLKGEKEYNIDYLAQEVEIEIEQNVDYEIEIDYNGTAKWLSYSATPTSRTDIEYETITFSAKQHTGGDSRTATITFINPEDEEANSEITISQSPKDAVVLGQKLYSVKSSGQIIDIEFASNVTDYTIEIPASDKSWIKVGEEAGYSRATMENYATTITVLENSCMDPRTSQLTIRAGEAEDKITIEQSGEILLNIDRDEIECSGWRHNSTSDKNTKVIEFKVEHNTEYTIDWDDYNECWSQWQHSLYESEGGVDTYHISMPQKGNMHLYGGTDPGSLSQATIVVRSTEDETATDQVVVTQWPRSVFSYEDSTDKVINNQSQIVEYVINSNVPFYGALFDADWLTFTEQMTPSDRYSDGQYVYIFKVSENSGDTRSVMINLIDIEQGLNYVTLTQTGPAKTLTINNENAGELHTLLSESDMLSTTELVITGMLDEDDFRDVINPMANLLKLDLSDATFDHNYFMENMLSEGRTSSMLQELILPSSKIIFEDGVSLSSIAENLEVIDFGGATKIPSSICCEFKKLKSINMPNATEIGDGAFSNSGIESVVIPEGVKSIGSAFAGCSKLSEVTLPSTSLLEINGAFSGTAITSMEIPASVKTLSGTLFADCKNLESVTFEAESQLESLCMPMGSYMSATNYTWATMFRQTQIKSITIPASVKSIAGAVFADCSLEELIFEDGSQLEHIEGGVAKQINGGFSGQTYYRYYGTFANTPIKVIRLPESIEVLSDDVFLYSHAEEIDLPNITTIGTSAFAGCAAHTIKIPKVKVLSAYALDNTYNLKTLDISSVEQVSSGAFSNSAYLNNNKNFVNDKFKIIGDNAFFKTSLESVEFANVTSVGMSAFANCEDLVEVKLPEVLSIGEYAFSGCRYLESIEVPKVTTLGMSLFKGCLFLDINKLSFESILEVSNMFIETDIEEIPSTMFPNATSVSNNAFYNCTKLTSVNLPSVEIIRERAFSNCSMLSSVTMPELTTLEGNVFNNCNNLATLDVSKVTSFSSNSFEGCDNLNIYEMSFPAIIEIPDVLRYSDIEEIPSTMFPNATSINSRAFEHCRQLRSVSLPNVESVGEYAFAECDLLNNISLPKVQTIEKKAFYKCASIEEITDTNLPEVTTIGDAAFESCTSLQSVSLSKLTKLEKSVFSGCTSLSSVDASGLKELSRDSFNGTAIEILNLPLVTEIDNSFGGMSNLRELYCPNAISVSLHNHVLPKLEKFEVATNEGLFLMKFEFYNESINANNLTLIITPNYTYALPGLDVDTNSITSQDWATTTTTFADVITKGTYYGEPVFVTQDLQDEDEGRYDFSFDWRAEDLTPVDNSQLPYGTYINTDEYRPKDLTITEDSIAYRVHYNSGGTDRIMSQKDGTVLKVFTDVSMYLKHNSQIKYIIGVDWKEPTI